MPWTISAATVISRALAAGAPVRLPEPAWTGDPGHPWAVMSQVYPQVVSRAQSAELTFDVGTVPLSDIAAAWQRTDSGGKRLVVIPRPAGHRITVIRR